MTNVRITTVGAYTVNKLSNMFAYVDAMIVDTPIVDSAARRRISDAITLRGRLERSESFKKHLDDQWVPLQDKPIAFDWRLASAALERDLQRVERRLPIQ